MERAKVKSAGLNVHVNATARSRIVDKIKFGDVVTITKWQVIGGFRWAHITMPGNELRAPVDGWVDATFIEILKPAPKPIPDFHDCLLRPPEWLWLLGSAAVILLVIAAIALI